MAAAPVFRKGGAAARVEGAVKRIYPARAILAVGGLVLEEGQVLLVRRGQEPGRGLWSLPGGVVRSRETLEAALVREVQEECGIEVLVEAPVDVQECVARDAEGRAQYHYVIVAYRAMRKGGDLAASGDVEDVRWVHPNEFHRYPMTPGTSALIRRHLAQTEGAPPRPVVQALGAGCR
jgi:ADP-ribose pyrophosphatase